MSTLAKQDSIPAKLCTVESNAMLVAGQELPMPQDGLSSLQHNMRSSEMHVFLLSSQIGIENEGGLIQHECNICRGYGPSTSFHLAAAWRALQGKNLVADSSAFSFSEIVCTYCKSCSKDPVKDLSFFHEEPRTRRGT